MRYTDVCGYCIENHYHTIADAEACAWIARKILYKITSYKLRFSG